MHSNTIPALPTRSPFDWMALLDTLLLVNLREQLDARAEHGREEVPFVRGL